MISVERREGYNLRISRVLREATAHRLDLYVFVPGELDLDSRVISEEAFYHNAIHIRRMYYSNRHQLPLVHSRLAGRGRLPTEHYRISLSLYAYQYVVALEHTTQQFVDSRQEVTTEQLDELAELTRGILRRLRRNAPTDDNLHRYYANIDNYLSWYTEQRLLRLVAYLPEDATISPSRSQLLEICQSESAHRDAMEYNSARANADPSRISNKMRLLRRLIEYPITLKQKTQELGGNEERAVKAVATGLVMIVVSAILLEARSVLGDLTLRFVLVLALLYAMREVFKEDLRNTLWRWLRKGRPRWRRRYLDVDSGETVGRQLEWLDYTRYSRLDHEIRQARKGNVTQREEIILRYRSSSRMLPTRFLSGYEETRETMVLDLQLFSRLMDRSTHHVYRLKEGEVVRDEVEKRYQLNLITRAVQGTQISIQRWKVTMNRSRIVDIEEVHVPDSLQTHPPAATQDQR